jgi:hypothetical protein
LALEELLLAVTEAALSKGKISIKYNGCVVLCSEVSKSWDFDFAGQLWYSSNCSSEISVGAPRDH